MMPTKTHSAGFMQASYRALALLLIALLSPFPALLAYWADASGDGINDVWVDSAYGTVFTLPELDAFSDDIDGDGLSNAQELQLGTDPFRPDTDEDGLIDGVDPAPADLLRSGHAAVFFGLRSRSWRVLGAAERATKRRGAAPGQRRYRKRYSSNARSMEASVIVAHHYGVPRLGTN